MAPHLVAKVGIKQKWVENHHQHRQNPFPKLSMFLQHNRPSLYPNIPLPDTFIVASPICLSTTFSVILTPSKNGRGYGCIPARQRVEKLVGR